MFIDIEELFCCNYLDQVTDVFTYQKYFLENFKFTGCHLFTPYGDYNKVIYIKPIKLVELGDIV